MDGGIEMNKNRVSGKEWRGLEYKKFDWEVDMKEERELETEKKFSTSRN